MTLPYRLSASVSLVFPFLFPSLVVSGKDNGKAKGEAKANREDREEGDAAGVHSYIIGKPSQRL